MRSLCKFCENAVAFAIISVASLAALVLMGLVCKIYWLLFLLGWRVL